MVCHYSDSESDTQSGIDLFCAAKVMQPRQRQDLAIQALARTETIRGLAAQHAVSRKFIYRQVDTAKEALQAGLERTLYALPHDAKEEFLPS